jgi:hypothetical protein
MVVRKRRNVIAAALFAALLAEAAGNAEPAVGAAEGARKAPTAELVDAQRFRSEIDAYVRELDRQMRERLNDELRRELAPKVVLAVNELRTRS